MTLKLVSRGPYQAEIREGLHTVGWCHKYTLYWVATNKSAYGTGPTAEIAFKRFCSHYGKIEARRKERQQRPPVTKSVTTPRMYSQPVVMDLGEIAFTPTNRRTS